MDDFTKEQIKKNSELLEKIYISTEKTRKYFMWTLIVSLVVFILPLIGFLFILPSALDTLTSGLI